MKSIFKLFFLCFYSFALNAQDLIQDTLFISFKDFSYFELSLINAEVEDSRSVDKNSLGIYEINKYWIIPVDLLIQSEKALSEEIQSIFIQRDSIDFPHYKIEIKNFKLDKNTNSLIYPHYVLNALINIYYSKEPDTSKYFGSLLHETMIGEKFFSDDLNKGFESVVHTWQENFVNDLINMSKKNHLFQNPLLENYRVDTKDVRQINFYSSLDYIYGLKDNLIDGEIYFSNREARKCFYRNGYSLRYRNSDNFESIEFGLSVDYLQYRINPKVMFKLKSQILIGANNWKDYRTYEHEFYDAFIGDLSLSQSIVYNPLDKNSILFGIGLSEDLSYIYSKGLRFHTGILFHLGIKL